MNSDVDIGALAIQEWQYSFRHIFFDIRITDVDVECRIEVRVASTQQDIADIKIDVDAHLWPE